MASKLSKYLSDSQLFNLKMQMKRLYFSFFLLLIFACNNTNSPQKTPSEAAELPLIDKLKTLDVALSMPKRGEWLSEHNESGQTFAQYKKVAFVSPNETQKCIYFQPIGNFSAWQNQVIAYTREYIEYFFGLKTLILPCISDSIIPASARRMNHGTEQLHTLYILDNILAPNIPKDAIVCMAITEKDLYPEKSWNFVFGQAYTQKRLGVSSIFRYNEKSKDSLDYNLCLERLMKTSAHEIGHMFTLQHCTHAVCVMNGSNSLSESDSRPNALCSECLKKLYYNLNFKNVERLQNLKNFYQKHHLKADLAIASAALEKL